MPDAAAIVATASMSARNIPFHFMATVNPVWPNFCAAMATLAVKGVPPPEMDQPQVMASTRINLAASGQTGLSELASWLAGWLVRWLVG